MAELITNEKTELEILLTVEEPNEWIKNRIQELQAKLAEPEQEDSDKEECGCMDCQLQKDPTLENLQRILQEFILPLIQEKYSDSVCYNLIPPIIGKRQIEVLHNAIEELPYSEENNKLVTNSRNNPEVAVQFLITREYILKDINSLLHKFLSVQAIWCALDTVAYDAILSFVHSLKEFVFTDINIDDRSLWKLAFQNVMETVEEYSNYITETAELLKLDTEPSLRTREQANDVVKNFIEKIISTRN